MNRRNWLKLGSLFTASTFLPKVSYANEISNNKTAKNIIFLVSDGMSHGTLAMADLMRRRKEGKESYWFQNYRNGIMARGLMDTASANSIVTDSAAGSSSWGSGYRVNNGSLNVGTKGENYKPIWQKFKSAGKKAGCVTTVPITHATPAGFCINEINRRVQDVIAVKYLDIDFDVMMGGGLEFFDKNLREDKRDLLSEFQAKGYKIAKTKSEMNDLNDNSKSLGIFYKNALPYTIDQNSLPEYQKNIPTLAELTQKAIDLMKNNPKGFVLQVEGGKVDWAAHGNDSSAIIYDQIAFDDAIKVAIDFAQADGDTLVIITTDHGNGNPGTIKSKEIDKQFDSIQNHRHSNYWILQGIDKSFTPKQIIERVEYAQNMVLSNDEAKEILGYYDKLDKNGEYEDPDLPFHRLSAIQSKYNGIGWISGEHSGDFVELCMYGAGSHLMKSIHLNTDLHYLMLEATQVSF